MKVTFILWTIVHTIFNLPYGHGAAISRIECSEPEDLERRFMKLNNKIDTRQLLIPHDWDDLELEFEHLFTLTNTHEISYKCPNTTYKGNYPLMIRSSCPWFFDTDWNEERYPKQIIFANTKCGSGCIGSNGDRTCERTHYQIKILKKIGCENNVYLYEEEDFLLPIGYTCAQAREAEGGEPVPPEYPEPVH